MRRLQASDIVGVSPSGKAAGFDPAIRRFESFHPSQLYKVGYLARQNNNLTSNRPAHRMGIRRGEHPIFHSMCRSCERTRAHARYDRRSRFDGNDDLLRIRLEQRTHSRARAVTSMDDPYRTPKRIDPGRRCAAIAVHMLWRKEFTDHKRSAPHRDTPDFPAVRFGELQQSILDFRVKKRNHRIAEHAPPAIGKEWRSFLIPLKRRINQVSRNLLQWLGKFMECEGDGFSACQRPPGSRRSRACTAVCVCAAR